MSFRIDKLTNSIENIVTGDSFQTEIHELTATDLKKITKKNGWLFDWKKEAKEEGIKVYKLCIKENPTIIQGLIGLRVMEAWIYMDLIESAPFNRGKTKMYAGVLGNLVAFACKQSLDYGFDGEISFLAKTKLVSHYEEMLGASHIGGGLMIIYARDAEKLISKYFNT